MLAVEHETACGLTDVPGILETEEGRVVILKSDDTCIRHLP
jgi:hypothetical protein